MKDEKKRQQVNNDISEIDREKDIYIQILCLLEDIFYLDLFAQRNFYRRSLRTMKKFEYLFQNENDTWHFVMNFILTIVIFAVEVSNIPEWSTEMWTRRMTSWKWLTRKKIKRNDLRNKKLFLFYFFLIFFDKMCLVKLHDKRLNRYETNKTFPYGFSFPKEQCALFSFSERKVIIV